MVTADPVTDISNVDLSNSDIDILLFVAAISPFLLRSLGDLLISYIIEGCCATNSSGSTEPLIGNDDSSHPVTINKVCEMEIGWSEAIDSEHLNINECVAWLLSIARFFLWHIMQVFVCCILRET